MKASPIKLYCQKVQSIEKDCALYLPTAPRVSEGDPSFSAAEVYRGRRKIDAKEGKPYSTRSREAKRKTRLDKYMLNCRMQSRGVRQESPPYCPVHQEVSVPCVFVA